MTTLNGKVAIVTGAGRGTGRGIAIALAREGARVVVASRTGSTVDTAVEEIRAAGGEAHGIQVDIGDRAAVFAMVEKTVEVYGQLDILFNVAQGFGPGRKPTTAPVMQPLETYDEDEWDHTIRTGPTASLWSMKAAFPHMKERGGRIINFASEFGIVGAAGAVGYNCAKEAIRALTRTAAREWGPHNITVNVISPISKTPSFEVFEKEQPEFIEALRQQIPLRRFGDPLKDGGGLAVFLASDASAYMTGMTFMLDGGHCMFP